jgi:glucokinase
VSDGTAEPGPGLVLALDVGGTKLAAGLVDTGGTLRWSARRPTPPDGSAEELFAAARELLERAVAGLPAVAATAGLPPALVGVGIGCGGPLRWPSGEVSPLNIPGWRDFPLRARVAELYPDVPVVLHNDAVAFAAAEQWRGAAAGAGRVLGVVVSTGVGGGLVVDGRPASGPTGNAGHVGHVVVEPDGAPCGCGGRGCLEAVARGPALVAWALAAGWRPAGGPQGAAAGPPDGVALAAAARAGDPVAAAALRRGGRAVGTALAGVTALLDLDVVVLGGGVSAVGPALVDPLRAAYAEHARMDFQRRVRIRPAALREPGLVGAAALVVRHGDGQNRSI